jgi:hypothetical protein
MSFKDSSRRQLIRSPSLSPFRLSSTTSTGTTLTSSAFSILGQKRPATLRGRPEAKKRRRRAEKTWENFREPTGDELKTAKDGQRLMYCQLCLNPRYSTAITSNAQNHMVTQHNIEVMEKESQAKLSRQSSLSLAFQARSK